MGVWLAPRPGGTRTRVRAPGGARWSTSRPGGSVWSRVPTPPPPPLASDADFTAAGTLSASVLPIFVQGAGFAAEGLLSVATAAQYQLAAALAADAALSVAVRVVGEDPELGADFTADAALSAATYPRHTAAAPLSAEATLSVAAFARYAAAAGFTAAGTLSAATFPRHTQVADYSATGTLSVVVQVVPQRAADFAAAGTLAVVTLPRFAAAAALSADATLSVSVVQKTDWSDNFDRGVDGSLGANWTTVALGTDTTVIPQVASNMFRAKLTTTNNQSNQCFAIATASAAKCLTDAMAVRGLQGAGQNGLFCGPMVRCDATGQNFVVGLLSTDTNNCGIWTRIGGGAFTRRTTGATSSIVSGDTFELRANGNVYTLIRNPDTTNTTVLSWTDTGNVVATGAAYRYGGMFHHSDRNTFGTQNSAPALDNFRVRDL